MCDVFEVILIELARDLTDCAREEYLNIACRFLVCTHTSC